VGESGSSSQSKNQSHWVKRTSLVDSRTNVTDIKFAPKHMGLLLAMCSADGGVMKIGILKCNFITLFKYFKF
jgi:nucleoporin SEH1